MPSLPPFDTYKELPNGVWFRANFTIAVDRPPFGLDDTTWDDHDCATHYVPAIEDATTLDVPEFVLTAGAANTSEPYYLVAG